MKTLIQHYLCPRAVLQAANWKQVYTVWYVRLCVRFCVIPTVVRLAFLIYRESVAPIVYGLFPFIWEKQDVK